jgi:enterochelin esterase-like enzyme
MEYIVYLPPCYDRQPDRRYPVLYLIHGQNYNNDQWIRLGVVEKADALIADGEIQPFIIVFPRDRSWAQPTQDMFGKVLVEGLIPKVDATYHTLPDRLHRAIGGLSRGGGWAVNLGLSNWELFGSIGADSPAIFWTDANRIRGWLDDIPPDELPRIYLDIGKDDGPTIMQATLWFEKLLTDKRIPHEWHLFPGRHEEAYWASHVEQYLRWYGQGW